MKTIEKIKNEIRRNYQRRLVPQSAKIQPILFMQQEGLCNLEKQAIFDGANELIDLAESDGIEIRDLGVWRNNNYLDKNGSLKAYQSVDWYLKNGKQNSRNNYQLNADLMLLSLTREPWKKTLSHYDIMAIHSDMYSGKSNFVIGLARTYDSTIISTNKFKELDDKTRYECIKTETMHELGHVFGLIPNYRTNNIEFSLGKHCTNTCIMRQGLTLPRDWVNMTKDRLKYGPLCNDCQIDLKKQFRNYQTQK